MPLKVLKCGGNPISSLEPLRGMPLKELWCNFTQISDLSPLAGMRLETLVCNNSSRVADLSPLRGLPLRTFGCLGCAKVTDLSPLAECKDLHTIEAKRTGVTAESVAALQKALPNCKIEWDGPEKSATPAQAPIK